MKLAPPCKYQNPLPRRVISKLKTMIIDTVDELFQDNHTSKAKHQSAGIRQIEERAGNAVPLFTGRLNLGTIAAGSRTGISLPFAKWIMRSKNDGWNYASQEVLDALQSIILEKQM
ncbi:MAG: hypothetical protein SRB2_00246 [Desulfobacteraceae bacterium Eth-SRB2]|nr:MAG: hypothetical protein SRB2_00246 [Desulfobacteraceae bacterium Eth-SRB2]